MIIKSVIYENWKYIISVPGSEEFFDLENDPGEKLNQITNNSLQSVILLLKSQLLDFEDNCKKYISEDVEVNLDEETLAQLKALGYVT